MTRARDVANVLTAANVLSTDIESAAAISAHTGITDPHPAYLQESTFSANQIVYKNASNEATGSANLTFSGSDLAVAGTIRSTASAGDEGGEIFLNKSATNTTLTGGVVLDVNQNRLRFFEQGGTNRGYYLDIASAEAGVATSLAPGGMVLLNTVTASGATSSFNSIPSGYKHLQVVFKNIVCATSDVAFYLRLNSDSASNYSYNCIGNGTGAPTTEQNISANYLWMSFTTNQSTDRFAYSGHLNIYRYAEIEGHHMDGLARANTATQPYAGIIRGFHSTGAAVTTVTFGSVSGNMSSGTAYLYGVK